VAGIPLAYDFLNTFPTMSQEITMDLDRIEGAGHEVKGAVKEAAGKVTGDKKTEIKGKVEKNVGTVQREVGEVKDELRDDQTRP